jgi:predicted SAM-dependent methyltransferase
MTNICAAKELFKNCEATMQMTPNEKNFLCGILRTANCYLEIGSGFSTIWASQFVPKIVSVEARSQWYQKISDLIQKANISNIDYYLLEPESCAYYADGTERWVKRDTPEGSDYGATEEFAGHLRGIKGLLGKYDFDVVLVDGQVRKQVVDLLIAHKFKGRVLLHDVLPSRDYLNRKIWALDEVKLVDQAESLVEIKLVFDKLPAGKLQDFDNKNQQLNKITGFCISNQDCDYDFKFAEHSPWLNSHKITICGNIVWLWGTGGFSRFIRQSANRIQIIAGYTEKELESLSNDRPDNHAVFINFYSDRIELKNDPKGSFKVFQGKNEQNWCISSNEDLVLQTMSYEQPDKAASALDVLSAQRQRLRVQINNSDGLKVIIGAGNTSYEGWIATNYPVFDARNEKHWKELFGNRLADNLLAEHVFEHLYYEDSLKAWKIASDFLKVGGRMRIAVPDKNNPSLYYRDLVRSNGLGSGADDHKHFWGYIELTQALERIGYKVELLECFDEKGLYHSKDWSIDDGYVERSRRYYKGPFTESKEEFNKMISSVPEHLRKQFIDLNIFCTSLIVDAIK